MGEIEPSLQGHPCVGRGSGVRRAGVQIGYVLLGTGVTGLLKRIEAWASQSEERSRMLIILIFMAFGILVAVFILVLALLTLDLG